jgi:hypothetical protein
MPTLEWTISIGTLIHLGGMVLLAIGAWFTLKGDMREIKMKVDLIWKAWAGEGGAKSYDVRLSQVEHDVANILYREGLKGQERTR